MTNVVLEIYLISRARTFVAWPAGRLAFVKYCLMFLIMWSSVLSFDWTEIVSFTTDTGLLTIYYKALSISVPPECTGDGVTLFEETLICNITAVPVTKKYLWRMQSDSQVQTFTTETNTIALGKVTLSLARTLNVSCKGQNDVGLQHKPCTQSFTFKHLRPRPLQQCDLAYENDQFQIRCIPGMYVFCNYIFYTSWLGRCCSVVFVAYLKNYWTDWCEKYFSFKAKEQTRTDLCITFFLGLADSMIFILITTSNCKNNTR